MSLRSSLKGITDAILRFQVGTRCFTNGGLAVGFTATKVNLGTGIHYTIGNVAYTKAATNDLFSHTDVRVQASGTTRYYLLTVNAAGDGTITQGTSSALPEVPSGHCPVGYLKVVAAATFTPGTTAHNAANITTTYVNLSQMPMTLA